MTDAQDTAEVEAATVLVDALAGEDDERTPAVALEELPDEALRTPVARTHAVAVEVDAVSRRADPVTPPLPRDATPIDAERARVPSRVPSRPAPRRAQPGPSVVAALQSVADRGKARGRWLRRAAAVAIAAFVLTLGGVAVTRRLLHPAAPPAAPAGEGAAASYRRALEHERAGSWEAAKDELGAAIASDPTLTEAVRDAELLDREIAVRDALAQAEAALSAADPAAASAALTAVPTGAADEAVARLQARIAAATPPPPAAASAPPARTDAEPWIAHALGLYRGGDVEAAIAALAGKPGPGASRLRTRLESFLRAVRSAARLKGAPSIAPLESAFEIDRALGGSRAFSLDLRDHLGAAHEQAGLDELAAARPADAFPHFARAAAVHPGSEVARRELERLRERARELFLSGYVDRDGDPEGALRKLGEVVRITADDEELHIKARRWLERIRGATRDDPSGTP